MKIEWQGIMPAVTTKFTSDDQLDLKLFGTNIKAQLKAGVHGIILGGSLGEASTLMADEKNILIRETRRLVRWKDPCGDDHSRTGHQNCH